MKLRRATSEWILYNSQRKCGCIPERFQRFLIMFHAFFSQCLSPLFIECEYQLARSRAWSGCQLPTYELGYGVGCQGFLRMRHGIRTTVKSRGEGAFSMATRWRRDGGQFYRESKSRRSGGPYDRHGLRIVHPHSRRVDELDGRDWALSRRRNRERGRERREDSWFARFYASRTLPRGSHGRNIHAITFIYIIRHNDSHLSSVTHLHIRGEWMRPVMRVVR